MAEETHQALSSKTSITQAVRVVHISNPTMVTATPSEFMEVVQSLTGRKVTATPSEFMEVVQSLTGRKRSCAYHGLAWDCEETHHVKVAKLQHHLSRSSNHRTPHSGSPISEERRCGGEKSMRNECEAFQVVHDEMSALFTSHVCETLENIGYSGFFSDLVFNQVEE